MKHKQRQRSRTLKNMAVMVMVIAWLLGQSSGCMQEGGTGRGTEAQVKARDTKKLSKGAQISLFMNIDREISLQQTVAYSAIEMLQEDSGWLQLSDSLQVVETSTIQGDQVFFGRFHLPTGHYGRLRLIGVSIMTEGEATNIADIEFAIHPLLFFGPGDSHSLFLQLGEYSKGENGDKLLSELQLQPKKRKLLVDIAYVACPEIDTVYMICTDRNRVCDSLGVTGGPAILVSDTGAPSENLFVLTENDRSIKIINPASNRVITRYPLTGLGKDLHFTTSPDSNWAYIADRKRGNILRVDLRSGSTVRRQKIGYGPAYVLYLDEYNLLAVSLSLAQSVILVDPETLTVIQTITTANKPEGMLIHNRRYLYIGESGANSVMIYDLESNKVRKRISVDITPRRLLAVNNSIYVANYSSRSLARINSGQLGVMRSIGLGGSPLEMAFSRNNKWLYIANESTEMINVVDVSVDKIVSSISLGSAPYDIEIVR